VRSVAWTILGVGGVALAAGCLTRGQGDTDSESRVQSTVACSVAFEPPVSRLAEYARKAGDLDGDGHLDLYAVTLEGKPRISVLRGDGTGAFSVAVESDLPSDDSLSPDVAFGDVDADGKIDLVGLTEQRVVVFPGLGDAKFGPASRAFAPTARELGPGKGELLPELGAVRVVDLEGDGRADILVTTKSRQSAAKTSGSGGLFVLRARTADGGATLEATELVTYDANAEGAFAINDYNGDGRADLLVANDAHVGAGTALWLGAPAGSPLPFSGRTEDVLLPASHGTVQRTPLATIGLETKSDFDGDRKVDAVVRGDSPSSPVLLYAGDGKGGFVFSRYAPLARSFPVRMPILSGDFDGDKRLDVALADEDGYAEMRCALGFGNVSRSKSFDFGSGTRVTAAGDFDEDGRTDLVMYGVRDHLAGSFVAFSRAGVTPPPEEDAGPPDASPTTVDAAPPPADAGAPDADAGPPDIDPTKSQAPDNGQTEGTHRTGWKELPVKPAADNPQAEEASGCSSAPGGSRTPLGLMLAALVITARRALRRGSKQTRRTRS